MKEKEMLLNKILEKVTRIEVIGVSREYVKHNIIIDQAALQDDNRTLKIFIHNQ